MNESLPKPICHMCTKQKRFIYATYKYTPLMGPERYLCDKHRELLHGIYIGTLERLSDGTIEVGPTTT